MNPHDVLKNLKEDSFVVRFACGSSPEGLRRALARTDEVRVARESLSSGVLTEDAIQDFVEALLFDFQAGTAFPHDIALATIAVLLESRPTNFAAQYLEDLSSLRRNEMMMSPGVAKFCLHARSSLARNEHRNAVLSETYPNEIWCPGDGFMRSDAGKTPDEVLVA